jgi:hypothetical protein
VWLDKDDAEPAWQPGTTSVNAPRVCETSQLDVINLNEANRRARMPVESSRN